ncbi:MAG TPA: Rid family hydrolase [Terriglobales bacterium]|nr:Rid family hydrolase [Terriglobales bacterium]
MKKVLLCAMAILIVAGASGFAQPTAKTAPKPASTSGKDSSMSSGRRYINLPGRPANLPFSDGVLVGDTLYLSGRIGIDPATGQAAKDINEELRLLFDGFEAVLAQAGMSMDDLVYVQVYSPDVSLWGKFNEAYVKRFAKEFPARAFLGSGPLLLGGRFEMVGVAVKR